MWTGDWCEWGAGSVEGASIWVCTELGVPFQPPPRATEAGQTVEVPPSRCHLRLIKWVCCLSRA